MTPILMPWLKRVLNGNIRREPSDATWPEIFIMVFFAAFFSGGLSYISGQVSQIETNEARAECIQLCEPAEGKFYDGVCSCLIWEDQP